MCAKVYSASSTASNLSFGWPKRFQKPTRLLLLANSQYGCSQFENGYCFVVIRMFRYGYFRDRFDFSNFWKGGQGRNLPIVSRDNNPLLRSGDLLFGYPLWWRAWQWEIILLCYTFIKNSDNHEDRWRLTQWWLCVRLSVGRLVVRFTNTGWIA